MSCVTFFLLFGQSGGASQWRVFYQRGLPRLVSSEGPQFFCIVQCSGKVAVELLEGQYTCVPVGLDSVQVYRLNYTEYMRTG